MKIILRIIQVLSIIPIAIGAYMAYSNPSFPYNGIVIAALGAYFMVAPEYFLAGLIAAGFYGLSYLISISCGLSTLSVYITCAKIFAVLSAIFIIYVVLKRIKNKLSL